MEFMTRRRRPRTSVEGRLLLALAIFALLVPATVFAEREGEDGNIIELLRSCDLAVQGIEEPGDVFAQ